MIAAMFEVWPADGSREEYLAIAGRIQPFLSSIDGYVSTEHFECLAEPVKVLPHLSVAARRLSPSGGAGPRS